MNSQGQIIIALLLTMLVGLTIGLVVTQRSVTDVTTSTQNEQASRAFSAAEAGIEKAISIGTSGTAVTVSEVDLGNQSSARVKTIELPLANQALEYPKPVGKETIAQFWLTDPEGNFNSSPIGKDIEVYFGNKDIDLNTADTPAIETNLIYKESSGYKSARNFYDPNRIRTDNNGFSDISSNCGGFTINTSNSLGGTAADRDFKCKAVVNIPSPPPTKVPLLLRVRLLYSAVGQPIAVKPGAGESLPTQAKIYTSTGKSGQSQKTIQVFKQTNVIPPFLDFAIFSAGAINK